MCKLTQVSLTHDSQPNDLTQKNYSIYPIMKISKVYFVICNIIQSFSNPFWNKPLLKSEHIIPT